MSNFHLRTFYYFIDPELRLIHAFKDCRAMKWAVKYKYFREVLVVTEDDAEKLDRLVEQKHRTCPACFGREQALAKRDRRRPRPGFLYPPKDYKPPAARPTPQRHAKKNVDRD
jgi:hypothetical protein